MCTARRMFVKSSNMLVYEAYALFQNSTLQVDLGKVMNTCILLIKCRIVYLQDIHNRGDRQLKIYLLDATIQLENLRTISAPSIRLWRKTISSSRTSFLKSLKFSLILTSTWVAMKLTLVAGKCQQGLEREMNVINLFVNLID